MVNDEMAFRRVVINDLRLARTLMLSHDCLAVYQLLRKKHELTSTTLAELTDVKLSAATNSLKHLYLAGYATRRRVKANTEGNIRTHYLYTDAVE